MKRKISCVRESGSRFRSFASWKGPWIRRSVVICGSSFRTRRWLGRERMGICFRSDLKRRWKRFRFCIIEEISGSDLVFPKGMDPRMRSKERRTFFKEIIKEEKLTRENLELYDWREYGKGIKDWESDGLQEVMEGKIDVVYKERQRKVVYAQLIKPPCFPLTKSTSFLSPFLMAQAMTQAMARAQAAKGKAPVVRTATLRLQDTDMEEKMRKFEKTLIGRLMNPEMQRMDLLIENFPKIWKLQDKIVGTDLGAGRFQFDFKTEEDIAKVMFQAPYHFDGFMVSLVNWEPSFAPSYPSAISFWVKLVDVPTHIMSEAILNLVGNVLGEVVGMDVPSGSVMVKVDGYSSLIFQVVVPLDTGIELNIGLEYDRLIGFCGKCFKITHDDKKCPKDEEEAEELAKLAREIKGKGTYAEVVTQAVEPSWENQKRHSAKRTLDFEEERHVFPYKKVGKGRHLDSQREEPQKGREDNLRGNNQSRGRDTYQSYRPSNQGRGNRGVASNWPPPLYQSKAAGNRTGGERVITKTNGKDLVGNTSTVEANQNTDMIKEAEAHSAEHTTLHKSPVKAAIAEEANPMEGVEGQGENQVDEMDKAETMEQGTSSGNKGGKGGGDSGKRATIGGGIPKPRDKK